MRDAHVDITLLGGFRVIVGGAEVSEDDWPARRAAELVQLLALAPSHRLTRDEAIEALWPTLGPQAGAANLRKAAHHARQALGDAEAVVLRGGQVLLFADRRVATDAATFEACATAALAGGDASACAAAAELHPAELLPQARYEEWAQGQRSRLRGLHLDLLRHSEQWERLAEADPTDEPAHRALMRRELAVGSRPAAIRWYGRLRTALRRELGIPPSTETAVLYDACVAGLGVAEPDFVGRQLELARIEALLHGGLDGTTGALVIRGPGGIGKSALSRTAAQLARESGVSVFTTAATEVGGPYAPLAGFGEQLAAASPAALDTRHDQARAALVQLAAQGTDPGLTRHQVIGALRRLLQAAGGGGPVVLLVDDTHLADDATVDVLQHLAYAGAPPILVVLAYRAEQAPELLTRTVARLARAGRAVELDLGPLDHDEAAALVHAGASTRRSDETVERIIELAQGNPFLTLELARSAVAGVPALAPTVRDAVTARLLDLDETTLAILRGVALAGDDLAPSSAVALAGVTEAEAFTVLDVALTSGALIVASGRYRFRHELVRQTLIEQIPPHGRIALHREIAQRLGPAGAEPGLIARHWLAGARPDDARAWQLAAAREAVGLGAFADAITELDALLAHDPHDGDALSLRAEALDALGDRRAPEAYLEAARAAGDPAGQDLRAKGGLAQIKLGDVPGGLAALEGLTPATLDGRIAHALGFAGAAAMGFTDPAVGTAKAAEARRLAIESGDRSAVVVASWAQAAAAHARGELPGSVRADLQETSALPQLAASAFDGQLCITQRLLYGSRPYAEVIAFADQLEDEAQRLGSPRGRAFAVTIRGEAKLLAGRLDDAEADLVAGTELHRDMGAATGEAFSLQRRAEVALHRGHHAQAAGLLEEALMIARESDVGFHLLDRIYGTKIAMARDDIEALAAVEEAEEAVRGPVETCPGCRITLAMPAAIAAARAGDRKRAHHWGEVAEYLTEVVMQLPAWHAAFEEFRGHRALMDGDAKAARGHFHTAAAGFAECEQPLDEQRCAALAT